MRKTREEAVKITEPTNKRLYRVIVASLMQSRAPESTLDAEWPEFNRDRDRIKANTLKFKDKTIEEAFGFSPEEVSIPEMPVVPELGKTYLVTVTKVGKDIIVEDAPFKEQVLCKNNLSRYKSMDLDHRKMEAKVVALDNARRSVTVDLIQPIFDSWISRVLADKTSQYNVKAPEIVTVHDLKLSRGGFIGKAEIPAISNVLGEPFYVNAFIPGSQIVLNIEKDFEQWIGKTVDTFVAGYTNKPGSVTEMSLICSRKALLNFSGNMTKIELYGDYCTGGKKWSAFQKSVFTGIVTGVINSSKKCGVFVELPMFNITGMVNVKPDKLVEYKSGSEVSVKITDFESMVTVDPVTGFKTHHEPYKIENGCLKSCILKPILEFA